MINKLKSSFETIKNKAGNLKGGLKLNTKVLGVVFGVMLIITVLYYLKGQFIAAVVNGQPIARAKVTNELERRSGAQILEGIINQTLIEQETKKLGIEVTQEELNQEVATLEEGLKQQGTTLEEAMIQQNLDRTQLFTILKTNKQLERLLADKVTVTDEEARAYLTANKDSFPAEAKEEELLVQIKTYLSQQKVDSESQKLFAELRAKANIKTWARY